MKISIITATYNSGRTVRDTIESVLHQTYHDFEYIIIDGASEDDTMSIIKSYEVQFEGRLRYISERDRGIYDAMNKGLMIATGDVVGVLNSDDLYKDERVLSDIAVAFACKRTECVYGNLEFVDADDTAKVLRTWIGSQYTNGAFLRGWHPAHPTFYCKRIWFEKFGGFDTSFDVSADFDLMLRFIEKQRLNSCYIDRYFVKMRLGGESTGSVINIIKGNKNILKAFEKNGYKVSLFYPVKRLVPKVIDIIKTKITNMI